MSKIPIEAIKCRSENSEERSEGGRMMRLMALIMSIFAVITTAWAGDTIDQIEMSDGGVTATDDLLYAGSLSLTATDQEIRLCIECGEDYPDCRGPIHIGDCNGPLLTDILQRCLEFVEDRARVDDLSTSIYSTPAVLYLHSDQSRQRDKIKDTEDTLHRQKEALKRMERETALRREIEKTIKILKGDK